MQREKVQYTAQAQGAGNFGRLSRFLVVLFAAMVSLAVPVIALGQQQTQPGATTQLEYARSAADAIHPLPCYPWLSQYSRRRFIEPRKHGRGAPIAT